MRRIERCVEAAGAWEERTGDVESPVPGSRLEADDARNPTLPASKIAWSSIGSAVDHLGLASDALHREDGARLRPGAFYTVCRGALVAASQAVWVLSGSREVRLRRVQLLELEEARSEKEFVKDYTQDESLTDDISAEAVAGLKARLERCARRERELRAELKPRQGEGSVTGMLRAAAAEVGKSDADAWLCRAFLFEWRAASADAHSRLWQREVRPGMTVPLVGRGTRVRYTTATAESYGQCLGAATMMTSLAWRLWDEQRSV